jgi:hypothetical protein
MASSWSTASSTFPPTKNFMQKFFVTTMTTRLPATPAAQQLTSWFHAIIGGSSYVTLSRDTYGIVTLAPVSSQLDMPRMAFSSLCRSPSDDGNRLAWILSSVYRNPQVSTPFS